MTTGQVASFTIPEDNRAALVIMDSKWRLVLHLRIYGFCHFDQLEISDDASFTSVGETFPKVLNNIERPFGFFVAEISGLHCLRYTLISETTIAVISNCSTEKNTDR